MQQGTNIIEMAKKKRHLHLLSKLQRGETLSPSELKELEVFEGPKTQVPGQQNTNSEQESTWLLRTQQDVAKFFRVRRRTIERWVAEDMPTTEDGRYDVRAIHLWREARQSKQKKLPFDKKINWEEELKKFQAQIKEMELKELKGELIPREEVEKERVARIIAVKRKLLSLPRAMAPQLVGLDPREIEVRLNERIREIIDAFAGNEKEIKHKHLSKESTLTRGEGKTSPLPIKKSKSKKNRKSKKISPFLKGNKKRR